MSVRSSVYLLHLTTAKNVPVPIRAYGSLNTRGRFTVPYGAEPVPYVEATYQYRTYRTPYIPQFTKGTGDY